MFFRLFSQFPNNIHKNHVTTKVYFYFYQWILLISYILLFSFIKSYEVFEKQTGVFLSNKYSAILSLFAISTAVFGAPTIRPKFGEFFYEAVYNVDKTLELVGVKINNNHLKRKVCSHCLC